MKKISVNENLIAAHKKKLTGTHYWWIWWTKKIGMILFAIITLGACTTEVQIKEVKKCVKVVDVQLFQSYFLGFPETRSPYAYKILDNGMRVKINPTDYAWGVTNWLENAKEMEIGKNYCWTEYERVK